MKVLRFVWGQGKCKKTSGLKRFELEDNYRKGRGKSRFHSSKVYNHFYERPFELPLDSPELKEVLDLSEEYLYKVLDYSDKDQIIPEEELAKYRDLFRCLKQGPRIRHFAVNPQTVLTSADVLFILSSNLPSKEIAKRYQVLPRDVKAIRRGEHQTWDWEYRFVKRLKMILRNKMKRHDAAANQKVYVVWRVLSPEHREPLVYTSSRIKAREIRDALVNTKERIDLIKKGLYDLMYPIEAIEVL